MCRIVHLASRGTGTFVGWLSMEGVKGELRVRQHSDPIQHAHMID